MPTIKDVAKEANVSVATVSRVINKSPKASLLAVESVTKAMQKLGYRPNATARALVKRTSDTVGVLVADVSDPFFGAMVKAIDKVAREQGKQILIGNGYHNADDERRALELLINSRCEAIIVHAKKLSDAELIAYVQEIPSMVVINRYIEQIASRCVALDNAKGAYLATTFLIEQGHCQIACIASAKEIEDSHSRIAGYKQALQDQQIPLDDDLIQYANPDSDGGEIAMQALLAKRVPFTAAFAYNDNMAAGALAALDEQGIIVPQQMSLVGFDDGIIARLLRPRLTTVQYPIDNMAEFATRLALAQNSAELKVVKPRVFSPALIKRNSTAAVN